MAYAPLGEAQATVLTAQGKSWQQFYDNHFTEETFSTLWKAALPLILRRVTSCHLPFQGGGHIAVTLQFISLSKSQRTAACFSFHTFIKHYAVSGLWILLRISVSPYCVRVDILGTLHAEHVCDHATSWSNMTAAKENFQFLQRCC